MDGDGREWGRKEAAWALLIPHFNLVWWKCKLFTFFFFFLDCNTGQSLVTLPIIVPFYRALVRRAQFGSGCCDPWRGPHSSFLSSLGSNSQFTWAGGNFGKLGSGWMESQRVLSSHWTSVFCLNGLQNLFSCEEGIWTVQLFEYTSLPI